jgi:ceramide glucosyltransferase
VIACFVLAVLAAISFGIQVWQYAVARRFPLHRRVAPPANVPAVSLLKPLKGCDLHTRRNLESWIHQDYGASIQILFAVRDAEDPVCALVRELIRDYPKSDLELVICPNLLGANAKVSSLAHLEERVRGEWVVVSDADVRVPPEFLSNLAAVQAREGVGLANCFYRLANPTTAAMRWEEVAINADFWSQVLQSRALQAQDFALGAVMALPKAILAQIGGFRGLVDHLADDYHLGHRVALRGMKIELCPLVVECWESPSGWGQVWSHQLRWARTIRVCQPLPYFASILSNLTLWTVLFGGACLLVPLPPAYALSSGMMVAAALVWRAIAAMDLQRRLNQSRIEARFVWMPWLKDLLGALIWIAAFVGTTVEWRGIRYRVGRDGKLSPV